MHILCFWFSIVTHWKLLSLCNLSVRFFCGHFILSLCDTASKTLISSNTQCSSLSVMDYCRKCVKSHLLQQITPQSLWALWLHSIHHPSLSAWAFPGRLSILSDSRTKRLFNSRLQLFCHCCKKKSRRRCCAVPDTAQVCSVKNVMRWKGAHGLCSIVPIPLEINIIRKWVMRLAAGLNNVTVKQRKEWR